MIDYKTPELTIDTTITKTVKGQLGAFGASSTSVTSKVIVDIVAGRAKLSRRLDTYETSIPTAEVSARTHMRDWLRGLTGDHTRQRFFIQSVELKKAGLDLATAKVTFSAEYADMGALIIDVEGVASVDVAEALAWTYLTDFIHSAYEKLESSS